MSENQTNQISLVRGLGLIAAISIIIGNVIGTGVFLKARVMTCNLGSPEWVIVAWIAAGFLSLAGALTYAELSAMNLKLAENTCFCGMATEGFGVFFWLDADLHREIWSPSFGSCSFCNWTQ